MNSIRTYVQGRVIGFETEQIMVEYTVYDKTICADSKLKYELSVYAKRGDKKQKLLENEINNSYNLSQFQKFLFDMIHDSILHSQYQEIRIKNKEHDKSTMLQYNAETILSGNFDDYYSVKHELLLDTIANAKSSFAVEVGIPVYSFNETEEKNISSVKITEINKEGLLEIKKTVDKVLEMIFK